MVEKDERKGVRKDYYSNYVSIVSSINCIPKERMCLNPFVVSCFDICLQFEIANKIFKIDAPTLELLNQIR